MPRPTKLTEENCLALTGHPYEKILGLSGIYGIHPLGISKKEIVVSTIAERRVIELEFSTTILKKLYVTIRLDDGIIENKEIVKHDFPKNQIPEEAKDISFKRLNSQIRKAGDLKFSEIRLLAYGSGAELREIRAMPPSSRPVEYIGYMLWAKYGFQMESDDQIAFEELISKTDFRVRNLKELQSTKAGNEFWEENGETWLGFFDLKPESASMRIFDEKRAEHIHRP